MTSRYIWAFGYFKSCIFGTAQPFKKVGIFGCAQNTNKANFVKFYHDNASLLRKVNKS